MAFRSLGGTLLRMGRLGVVAALVGAGALGIACGSEGRRDSGPGGSGGPGPGQPGGPGEPGAPGGPGLPNDGNPLAPPLTPPPDLDDEEYCQEADVLFQPRTPTVYLLVDRSSSMFGATNFWGNLKDAVLPVIQDLESEVRFGFAAYTGHEGGAVCPELSTVPIAENNYAAIAELYNSLGQTTLKGETPTIAAVQEVKDILLADPSPGDRFILLVTDGEPDFCDDPHLPCGTDALIASLQIAAAEGVRTLVFAIDNSDIVRPEWFDYYAQAGMGQEPNWADGLDVGEYTGKLQSECSGDRYAGWRAVRTANGNTGEFDPAGRYSEEGGTATAFFSSDTGALAAQIRSAIEDLKSCTFDLGDSDIEVKAGSEDTGKIFVDDELVPADQWRMIDSTTLELLGAACEKWQKPEVTKFFAGFPCESIIIVVR